MSRPIGSAEELERRRKQAVHAVIEGEPRQTVARILGVTTKTISRWVRAARAARRPGRQAPARPSAGIDPR